MTEFLGAVAEQFLQSSLLELTAVVFAIAYLILAVKENSLCWYAAAISTLIFLAIFWEVKLYMESGLQVFYLAMAAYGWYQWRSADDGSAGLQVSMWTMGQHAIALTLIALLTFLSGYLLQSGTDAQITVSGFVYDMGERGHHLYGGAQGIGKLDLLAGDRFSLNLSVYRP